MKTLTEQLNQVDLKVRPLRQQIEPLILEIIHDTTEFTCKGNQSKAARLLGISRTTLRKYLSIDEYYKEQRVERWTSTSVTAIQVK